MAIETSPHDLIMSSRVVGAHVFNKAGERIGEVEDLSIHKVSGKTVYAIISFGGFLGIGEQLHPLPSSATRPTVMSSRSWAPETPGAPTSSTTTAPTAPCPTSSRPWARRAAKPPGPARRGRGARRAG